MSLPKCGCLFPSVSRRSNALSARKLEGMGFSCYRTRSTERMPKGNSFIGPLRWAGGMTKGLHEKKKNPRHATRNVNTASMCRALALSFAFFTRIIPIPPCPALAVARLEARLNVALSVSETCHTTAIFCRPTRHTATGTVGQHAVKLLVFTNYCHRCCATVAGHSLRNTTLCRRDRI